METFKKCMFLISIGLMAWLNGNAQTVISGGNVSGKWTKANSPYNVIGSITVAKGTTLEIEPGVTVAFAQDRSLTVNGQLLAQGTSNDNIVFTRQSTNNWSGLNFSAQGENESVVRYASIQYSNSCGVRIENGTVTLNYNIISNNNAGNGLYYGGGVHISGGKVTLSNTLNP